MSTSPQHRLLLTLGILAAGIACSEPAERRPIHDLVQRLPIATTTEETSYIDVGTREASGHLVSGWAYNEATSGGDTFAWSTGDESVVEFELLRPRDLTLSFRARPLAKAGLAPPTLIVSVNGHDPQEIELQPGTLDYQVGLEGDWLQTGDNRLTIRYRFEPGTTALRRVRNGPPLAAAWFHIRLDDGEGEHPGVVRTAKGGRAIAIPWSAQVDYFLRLPAHSELSVTSLQPLDEGLGRLVVTLQGEGGSELEVGDLAPNDQPARFELVGDRPQTVRLSLRALLDEGAYGAEGAEATARRGSGLLVLDPIIDAPTAGIEAPPVEVERAAQAPRPNIIIYLVDTLRADRLGCYGYPKPVSPNIDRFASEAALFERAVANAPWTRPAVASLFTGLWPVNHGTQRGQDKLSLDALTLAELLADAGYRTSSIVANPNAGQPFGLDQGFEHYRFGSRLSDWINEEATDWLDNRSPDEPFFLYLHTKDPHDPYDPPQEFRERFASEVPLDFPTIPVQDDEVTQELIDGFQKLYDGDIAFNDDQFGRLLGILEQQGLYDDSLILFLSDHGEEFQEHGSWLHGTALFGEQLDVPMILKLPRQGAGSRIPHLVQQVDVLPTILDYLGLERTPGDGRSLLPLLRGEMPTTPGRVFSHLRRDRLQLSVIDGGWKLIQKRRGESVVTAKLFDTLSDPDERVDLQGDHPVIAGYLATLLEEKLLETRRLSAEVADVSPEIEADLRALGYVQ